MKIRGSVEATDYIKSRLLYQSGYEVNTVDEHNEVTINTDKGLIQTVNLVGATSDVTIHIDNAKAGNIHAFLVQQNDSEAVNIDFVDNVLGFDIDLSKELPVSESMFLQFYYDGSSLHYVGSAEPKYDSPLDDNLASTGLGGIEAGTTVGDLKSMNLTFPALVDMLLFPTVDASVATNKSLSLSATGAPSTVEVGTSITAVLTAVFNRGKIRNGDNSNGPDLVGNPTSYTFSGPGVTDGTVSSNALTETITADSINASFGANRWQVSVQHDAGTGDYFTNKNTVSTSLDALRVAATISSNSNTINGRYYAFYGVGSIPTDSASVRALPNKLFLSANNTGTFTILILAGENKIAFAVPSGKTVKVTFRESSAADVTGSFTKSTIDVLDAGAQQVSYDLYTSSLAGTGYGSDSNYDVTVS